MEITRPKMEIEVTNIRRYTGQDGFMADVIINKKIVGCIKTQTKQKINKRTCHNYPWKTMNNMSFILNHRVITGKCLDHIRDKLITSLTA